MSLFLDLMSTNQVYAERVYGDGAANFGADRARTFNFPDETVDPPLGVSWSFNYMSGTPVDKGLTLTNYRVYFGQGSNVFGLNDQTGDRIADDFVVGKPFSKNFNSSYGSVTSALEISQSPSSPETRALFFGTSGSRLGRLENIDVAVKSDAQNVDFSSSLGGGAIKYITHPYSADYVMVASDQRTQLVSTDELKSKWKYDVPGNGKFTGVTTLESSKGSVLVTTDHGLDEGHAYIFERPYTKSGSTQNPDIDIEFFAGLPKASTYDNSSETIHSIDKEGRVYRHSGINGNRIQLGYIGDSENRGYESVGGMAIDERYGYASTLKSSQGNKGTITKFRLNHLGIKETYIHNAPITTTPILLGELLYFGDSNGKIYALNPNTMQLVDWYLDENFSSPQESYDIGSKVQYILGADNHLIASSNSRMYAFKGRPDYLVSDQELDGEPTEGKRINYTTSPPKVTLTNKIENRGTFDYSVYTDFGGINAQEVDLKIKNLDNNRFYSYENVQNNVPDKYKDDKAKNDPFRFQVPSGKSFDLSVDFNIREEGRYEVTAQADYLDEQKLEFGQYPQTKASVFDVVNMRRPEASVNNNNPIQGEKLNFDLTVYQEFSQTDYEFKITDPLGKTIHSRSGGANVPGNLEYTLSRYAALGTYKYQLSIENRYGDTLKSYEREFTVATSNEAPIAGFDINPNPTDRTLRTNFTSTASDPDGDSLKQDWTFRKKGETTWEYLGGGDHPFKYFEDVGTFEVKQTVTDPEGLSDSIVKEVVVNNLAPIADFRIFSTPTDRLSEVTFINGSDDPDNDSITSTYAVRKKGTSTWTEFSTEMHSTYTFPEIGIYEVKLTVKDAHGATASVTKEVETNNIGPKANFTVNPNPTDRITKTEFTSLGTDPEGDQLFYKFSYRKMGGDQWVEFDSKKLSSFYFPEIGTYEVLHEVTDFYGDSHSVTRNVYVENNGPIADFEMNPDPTDIFTDVKVTDKASDPENDSLTYEYTYLNKNTGKWTSLGNIAEPTFKLPYVGKVNVRQTVTDPYGKKSSMIKEIEVANLAPKAGFSINPNPTDRLTETTITSSATDPENGKLYYVYEYREKGTSYWKLMSASESFDFKFPDVGEYEVKQTVKDQHKGSDTAIQEVTVKNLNPVADFEIKSTPTNRLTVTNFESKSSDPEKDRLTYLYEYRKKGSSAWQVIDSRENSKITFSEVGKYEVRLTVTDEYGDTGSKIKEVTVENLDPKADFSINPNPSDRLTDTQFFNLSTDPEDDQLSFEYQYREKGESNWKKFGSNASAKMKFANIGTYEIMLTVTDSNGGKDSKVRELIIKNNDPVADFDINPNPTDRLTETKLISKATDPENDSLTYTFEVREEGTNTWSTIGTTPNEVVKLSEVKKYEIRHTVTDEYGGSDSQIKEVEVSNRKPEADFTINKNPSDRLTTVIFTNKSSDPEKDNMTYRWYNRIKDTGSWKEFSTEKNPSMKFPDVATYEVKLITKDEHGAASEKIRELTIENVKPEAGFTTDKPFYYVGDSINFTSTASDPEDDQLTIEFTITKPDGELIEKSFENVKPGEKPSFTILTDKDVNIGEWKITQTVIDTFGSKDTLTKNVEVRDLEIVGSVNHVEKWKEVHEELGNPQNAFFSGERFLIESNVTNHPIKSVKVKFTGKQIDNNTLTLTQVLSGTHPNYSGEIFEPSMADPRTKLMNGKDYFLFTAEWENGVVRTDLVSVQIIDDVYNVFNFHRTN